MAKFPKIQSPCPYKSNLAAVMDGDHCRMCQRQVFDLTAMSDGERVAFLAGCADEVCVSYRLPLRSAIAAAALAAAAIAVPAHAQEVAAVSPPELLAADTGVADVVPDDIIVGGIKYTLNVEFIEDPADSAMAALPVVYEDSAPATPPAAR